MKKLAFVLGLLFAGLAHAATFNLFSPATGVLKGSSSTYVTSAAASSDIIGLWTGTCNSTTFLRADGSCQTAGGGGGGSVTSVALTAPSIFSVTGSPVTTSGTLAFAYSGAQGDILFATNSTTLAALAKNTSATRYLSNTGTTNNPAWAQIDLTNGVTGTLPAANGGTGVTASTGTGNVVLSASPTLTGTVTAATVAATSVTVGGNAVCQSTGTNCPSGIVPHAAYGRFTVGSSTCSFVAGAGVSSCAYNGAGNVTVTFSATAGTGGWICTANSAANTTARAVRVSGASTTTINILTYDLLTGTLTDTDYTMVCMAN